MAQKKFTYPKISTKIFLYSSVAIIILLLLIVIAVSIGAANIPITQTYRLFLNKIPFLNKIINISDISLNYQIIIFKIRLPRIFLAVLVGMALSGSGVMYQGLFRNPMADPYVIGISSGASLGATIAIIFGLNAAITGISGIVIAAFSGSLAVSFFVFQISRDKRGFIPVLNLILSGIAVGSLCSAGTSFLMMFGKEEVHKIIFWVMGSLTTANWTEVKIIGPIIIICIISLFFFTRDLNRITLGEERAKQLGVNTELTKNAIIIITSFLVAASVSVSGIIGFIGLVVPHIMRIIFGADNRLLYPISTLIGGIILLLADMLARNILSPREIPVGILTALLGSPFFIYLLKSAKNKMI